VANIVISDLFADTDSFLTELSGTDLQVAGGGGHKGGYGRGGSSDSGSGGGKGGRGGSSDSGSGGGKKGRGGHGRHGHKCW
jgi:hypothetical protein